MFDFFFFPLQKRTPTNSMHISMTVKFFSLPLVVYVCISAPVQWAHPMKTAHESARGSLIWQGAPALGEGGNSWTGETTGEGSARDQCPISWIWDSSISRALGLFGQILAPMQSHTVCSLIACEKRACAIQELLNYLIFQQKTNKQTLPSQIIYATNWFLCERTAACITSIEISTLCLAGKETQPTSICKP